MRLPRPQVVRTLPVIVIAGLAIGCGGGDAASDQASSSTRGTDVVTETTAIPGGDATVASTVSEPTDPPATSAAVTTAAAASTTVPSTGDGECLVGDWVVTESEMNEYYDGLMSTLDAPMTFDVTGSAPLSFAADGTYRWNPDFTLTVELMGQLGTGVAGGTITGVWSAVDGVVTTTSDVNALTMSVTVGGVTVEGDDFANGLLNSSPVSGVTYSCAGEAPVLDFLTGDPAVTVPVTLTPA